jgi:hypothetical protein
MPSSRIADEELGALVNSGDAAVRRLAGEVLRLRAAIASHAAKRGHELCWLNDVELWKSIGIDAGYPHDSLPVREEFLAQCVRYYASRVTGTPYQEPPTGAAVALSQ